MLGFTIGLRTLRAAQWSMDLVGQNVANATTAGYSRRLASLATTAPQMFGRFGVGTGVAVDDLIRVHDGLLELRLREQRDSLGRLDATGGLMRQMQSALQEPGESGISARLDDLWNAFSQLTGFPDDSSYRSGLVQAGDSLTASFRDLAAQMSGVGEQARQGASGAVDAVNVLLVDLANVNQRAMEASGYGGTPPDLLDERDRLLGELSDWVDVQAIERPDGSADVLIDGILVVSADRASRLESSRQPDGSIKVNVQKGGAELDVKSGRLRGYMDLARLAVPERQADLDAVARELILEVNRIHTTSVSGLGPYGELVAGFGVGADRVDDALSTLDLPFAMSAGRITVNVVESATGAVEQHFLDVDPDRMSLADLAAALDGIDHLSASVDSAGRLRVDAEAGFGFDFSSRLDADPDDAGSFGSDQATLTSGTGPFALSNGDTLTLAINGGAPVTVTFNSADFADIANATAEEIAAVIETQIGASGIAAVAQDGRLVLATDAGGEASSLQVTAASNPALFAVGASDVGAEQAVAVALTGAPTSGYEGEAGHFTVRALGDGVIGVTPGLEIELLDGNGASVGIFDVGEGYVPGDPLELVPGVTLTLTAGSIQQSAGDVFEFDLVGDADTADALVALELGAFFHGSGAADIALADAIANDSRMAAGSRYGLPNDGSGFTALLGIKDRELGALEDRTVAQSYGDLVAGIGFEVSSNDSAAVSQLQLYDSLAARRDEISGVNLDEEMLKLIELQHLYEAAGRYLQSVSEMTDVLFQLL